MTSRLRFQAALTVCFLVQGGLVWAQETARWLSSADEAKLYAAAAERLTASAETVIAAKVPERLFLDRLKEGVRKRASAERLVKAMEDEADRLVFLAKLFDQAGLDANKNVRERALSDCALYLRASATREEVAAAARKAAAVGGGAERVAATVAVVAAADQSRIVSAGTRLELTEAIAGSDLKTERIDSIVSVFARGRAFGLTADRVARIVIDQLASGGTLPAIDSALNRERNKR